MRDWDVDVINQHESTGNEMAVLSHTPQDIINSIDPKTGRALETKRTIMCETHYLKENYLSGSTNMKGASMYVLIMHMYKYGYMYRPVQGTSFFEARPERVVTGRPGAAALAALFLFLALCFFD